MQEQVMINTSQELWINSETLALQCLYHPFVISLGDGTLPRDCFLHYESQDVHYLRAFKKGHVRCLELSKELGLPGPVQERLHNLVDFMSKQNVEVSYHEKNLQEQGMADLLNDPTSKPTKDYIDFLTNICDNTLEVIEILVSMLPCYRLYGFIGQQLQQIQTGRPNQYSSWIDLYSGQDFLWAVQEVENIVDALGANFENKGLLQEIYNKAMELELKFFGDHPNLPNQRKIGCVISDFDDTITNTDTTSIIIQSIIQTKVETLQSGNIPQQDIENFHTQQQQTLQYLVDNYSKERQELLKEILPVEEHNGDFDYEILVSIINNVSEFERRQNQKVIDSQLLQGAKIDVVYNSIEQIQFREKAREVIHRIIYNNLFVRIVSVTYCAPFVAHALQLQNEHYVIHERSFGKASDLRQRQNKTKSNNNMLRSMLKVASQNRLSSLAFDDVQKVVVYGNDLEIDENRITTGDIIRRVQNGDDKLAALDEILLENAIYQGSGMGQSVYIGDSMTDILPMLAADVGIVVGENQLLRRVCKYAKIQIKPLVACPLINSREVSASSVDIYQANSWLDIECFLFGSNNPQPTSQQITFPDAEAKISNGLHQPDSDFTFGDNLAVNTQQIGNEDTFRDCSKLKTTRRESFQADRMNSGGTPFRTFSSSLKDTHIPSTEPIIDSKYVDINSHRVINYFKATQQQQANQKGDGHTPCVLIIAGSDSGGGAGIQADIKSCSAVGTFATTVITALTAQNTHGVQGVQAVSSEFVGQQLQSVLEDFKIHAVKIGMLMSEDNVKIVAELLQKYQVKNIVLDPVLVSSSKHSLADNISKQMVETLFKHVTVITPNIPEAETLLELQPGSIQSVDDMVKYAKQLQNQYASNQYVIIKGGHQRDILNLSPSQNGLAGQKTEIEEVTDVLVGPSGKGQKDAGTESKQCVQLLKSKRVEGASKHGTGCTFSTLIANGLAVGFEPVEAMKFAKSIFAAIMEKSQSFEVGSGPHTPLDHQQVLPLIIPIKDCVNRNSPHSNVDYGLYAVTDNNFDQKHNRSFRETIQQAVDGGANIIQIRDKNIDGKVQIQRAREALEICRPRNVPVIINDRVDVCIASDADGVHVGQDDIDALATRKMVGPGKIVGVSVKTVEEAKEAIRNGATYLGAGSIEKTGTKDSSIIGLEGLSQILAISHIPVVAIGGINLSNASQILKSGCQGLAVVSTIFDQIDVTKATQELSKIIYNHKLQ